MTEKKETPQEIDLVQLFSNMGNGIGNLLKNTFGLVYKLIYKLVFYIFIAGKESTRFLLKNAILILAFTIMGYFVGIGLSQMARPYYRTTATVQTFTVSSSSLIEFINKLTPITEAGDSVALSKLFDISVSEAATVKKIEAFWLIDKNNDGVADEIDYDNKFFQDTITKWEKINNRFLVQLQAFEPEYINLVQEKFENYLLTYPRLGITLDTKRKSLQTKIQKLDNEIVIIDSLKAYEYFTKPRIMLELQQNQVQQKQMAMSLDKILFQAAPPQIEMLPAPTLLHDVTLPLYSENIENKAALELTTDPFIFLDKFFQVANPVDINKENMISIKLSALFFMLGVFLSLVIKFRKEIFGFIKE